MSAKDPTENVEFSLGYSDAKANHGPSLLGGPYMEGYKKGRHEMGRTVGIHIGPPPEKVIEELRARIRELEAQICTYPDGLCKCPHFRGTP